jgi:two-component system phosphate regulon sensor histidine kinase PhoR
MLLILALILVPLLAIVARTYSQLGAESRFRDRRAAEEVSAQFDRQLFEQLKPEEERPFEDYQFLRPGALPAAQLSPLAQPGVRPAISGLVGYFQLQPNGEFSSPLLPGDPNTDVQPYGIAPPEAEQRRATLRELHRLVAGAQLERLRDANAPAAALEKESAKDSLLPSQAKMASRNLEERKERKSVVNYFSDLVGQSTAKKKNAATDRAAESSLDNAMPMEADEERAAPQAANMAMQDAAAPSVTGGGGAAGASMAAMAPAPSLKGMSAPRQRMAGEPRLQAPPAVTQFLAVIEPFRATLLDSGHLLFFRRVSHEEKLFVQGFVVKAEPFLRSLAEGSFLTSALAANAGLAIQSGTKELGSFSPGGSSGSSVYSASAKLHAPELARFPVAPPLRQLELVFSTGTSEAAPGEFLLHFLTASTLLVLLVGFLVLYRAASAQIDFAAERGDFVSAVSHELKTPLTSIRMYAEMLKSGMAQDPAKQATYLDFILGESERLSRLIGNVLQMAKLSKGGAVAINKPHTAGALLERARARAEAQAQAAGFQLEVQSDAALAKASLLADEDCFTQIIVNLVDNALKFSAGADDKTIVLGLRNEPGERKRVAFTVRDHGPGVPKEERKKIFQLFYRAENELTRKTPGTGIGLALVAQLANEMGAAVDMRNVEPAGAEFRVIFPVR